MKSNWKPKKIQIPIRRSSSSNSESLSHFESPHSPLRFESPLRSDLGDPPGSTYSSPIASPEKPRPPLQNSVAVVATDKSTQYSPALSPIPPDNLQAPPHGMPDVVLNRNSKDGATDARVMKMKLEEMSMASTKGWSGDSFDRYKEYRYCLAVNVIGFVYAGFQAYDLSYHIATGKHVIRHHLRYRFNLFMDQILAYLLVSAASSSATRVDDWQSNWGKDEFTKMATVSVVMAFLAFIAYAGSSLISGYNLYNHDAL
ncbi:NITRATE FORMATE IRON DEHYDROGENASE [Salix purpurea]|uniref:CASP-like protein n=1 Tax=Salix purpurea TaxID=77065 RepID=A0A9Q0W7L3_SALPP|nr:NITRATE FORMATE IRON DEHYDROGENASE [Salix purpurea]